MRDPDLIELRRLLRTHVNVKPWEIKPFIKHAIQELKEGRPYGFHEELKFELNEATTDMLQNRMADFASDLISRMVEAFEIAMVREMRRITVLAMRNYDKEKGVSEEALNLINAPFPKKQGGWHQR